jgi:tetratricopeptide (TPR) repeat protein
MLPFLNRVGARAGMLELARNAVAATRELGDRRGESLALATFAAGLRGQGRPAEMHAALQLSVRISREVGDPAAIAARVHDLGNFLFQAGRLAEAAASFAEARDLARDLGDRAAEVSDTFNLAVVDCNLGRYDNALEHFNRALAHHRQDGNAEGEYAALINIGWVSQLQDRDGDAVAALDRAVQLSRAIGAVDRESRALAWLAVSYRRLGQVLKAIEVGRAAVDAARRTELPEHECDALNGLGEACLAARRWAEAETAFRAAERLAGAGALPMEGSRAIEGLAHLAAAHGALDRARQLWERALAGYQPGAVEAENPQAHLLAPDGAAARCMRCQTAPVSGQ